MYRSDGYPYKMGMPRSDVRRARRKARALVNIVALTKKVLRSKNKTKKKLRRAYLRVGTEKEYIEEKVSDRALPAPLRSPSAYYKGQRASSLAQLELETWLEHPAVGLADCSYRAERIRVSSRAIHR